MDSRSEAAFEENPNWLEAIAPFRNDLPKIKQPFVTVRCINRALDGCFICGRKHVSRHHIFKGRKPLVVYLCLDHHKAIHGTCLEDYPVWFLRTLLVVADTYNLYKKGEENMVRKKILTLISDREIAERNEAKAINDELYPERKNKKKKP